MGVGEPPTLGTGFFSPFPVSLVLRIGTLWLILLDTPEGGSQLLSFLGLTGSFHQTKSDF